MTVRAFGMHRGIRSVGTLVTGAMVFGIAVLLLSVHVTHAQTLGPNLISNPSFETAGSNGLPSGWLKGGYGNNTRILSYPATPAHTGSRAANVQITHYVSGDAKWYFPAVSVTPGATYHFSDYYMANVPSEVDVQLTHSDGSHSYLVLGTPGTSASYKEFSADFTVPAGVTSLTIFHVIDRVGSMTVDDYALNKVTESGNTNLVTNGTFTAAGSNGNPAGWLRGGWGGNTRSYAYPVTGASGTGAEVSISQYSSGDAKWYFAPIAVAPGIYRYTDEYKANVPSILVAQLHNADGSYSYDNLAYEPASNTFRSASADFVVPQGTKDVTVFHLINSVGSLTIDNVSMTKQTFSSGVFSTGAVTLTFDNGWLSQFQNAVPKMANAHIGGTFYIITHELANYGYPGFMSKKQIQQTYADGNEIGSHTQTHPDLPTLSTSQQQQEISGSRSDLQALNVGPINSFAYPFGDFNATTISLVKQAGYTNARATLNGYAVPTSDVYLLPRLVMLNTTTLGDVEQWINTATSEHVWLIIEFHQIDNSGDTYATSPALFDQIVNYLTSHNVNVVTMAQGVQSL